MSKKKALFYNLTLLSINRPYASIDFFDKRERKLMSSVDVVLNLEYFGESAIAGFISTR
jgi:hypothetical protein